MHACIDERTVWNELTCDRRTPHCADRSHLAETAAHTPFTRLDICRDMGILARAECVILRIVRRRVYESGQYTQHDTQPIATARGTRKVVTSVAAYVSAIPYHSARDIGGD